MGGFMGIGASTPDIPTPDTSLQDAQLAKMQDEVDATRRKNESRMRTLAGRGGGGSGLLRFGGASSGAGASSGGTTSGQGTSATLGG